MKIWDFKSVLFDYHRNVLTAARQVHWSCLWSVWSVNVMLFFYKVELRASLAPQ